MMELLIGLLKILAGVLARHGINWLQNKLKERLPEPSFKQFDDDTPASVHGAFKDFYFANRSTTFFEPESAWHDLEAFCASEAGFRWWLLYGSAGMGKSRTALEFCQKLKATEGAAPIGGNFTKKWEAGFVDLDKTSFEVWKKWQPRQATFLVLDHVNKEHIKSSIEDDKADNDSRQQYDIAKIIDILTKRSNPAENQGGSERLKPFRHRVRLLLLEREYQEEHGKEREELGWYKNLERDSCYKAPAELTTVGGEALVSIAKDALRKIPGADSAGLPDDFIEKLTAIDREKRPLFAMLLACYLVEKQHAKGDIAKVEPYDVLDYAISVEFQHIWNPAGVKGALLDALAKSTLTGGAAGDCALDEKQQKIVWNSGLINRLAGSGESKFRFLPVRPDLLGEYFILTGAGRESDAPLQRIEDSRMQALIDEAWRDFPYDTAMFFDKCGRDFISHPNFKKRFLNEKMSRADPLVKLVYASVSVNLIFNYGDAGQLPEARDIFDAMSSLGDSEEIRLLRAKASFNLINAYGDAGQLTEARDIFDAMSSLGD